MMKRRRKSNLLLKRRRKSNLLLKRRCKLKKLLTRRHKSNPLLKKRRKSNSTTEEEAQVDSTDEPASRDRSLTPLDQANYEEIIEEMNAIEDEISTEEALEDVKEMYEQEMDEINNANEHLNRSKLAKLFKMSPDFFDKLDYFFTKFKDGWNIYSSVSFDMETSNIVLVKGIETKYVPI